MENLQIQKLISNAKKEITEKVIEKNDIEKQLTSSRFYVLKNEISYLEGYIFALEQVANLPQQF